MEIQSSVLPPRWTKCARWTFLTLLLINILSFSLFLSSHSSKLIVHVVQHNTAIATDTLRNGSFLTMTKCLFIVRSDNKNLELRNIIRKSWYNGSIAKDIHNSSDKTIDAKLQFIIEDLSNNTKKYGKQDLQFNDTLWIQNSEPKSIESVRFLEVMPTAHYYIISLDTTFVNFDNVVHFLQGQGKFILEVNPHY